MDSRVLIESKLEKPGPNLEVESEVDEEVEIALHSSLDDLVDSSRAIH